MLISSLLGRRDTGSPNTGLSSSNTSFKVKHLFKAGKALQMYNLWKVVYYCSLCTLKMQFIDWPNAEYILSSVFACILEDKILGNINT